MEFDPDEVRRKIADTVDDPGVLAYADQRQAAIDEALRTGTWWASLIVLSQERGEDVSYATAVFTLRTYIAQLPEGLADQIAAFLMMDTVFRIAKYQHGGDVAAAVASILTPDAMLNVEKFVATDGRACSFCGADEGWGDHRCKDDEQE